MYLVSKGYLEGFYYKPRIDLDLLRERSEGLIATSGCLSSMICRAILGGEVDTAWRLTEEFARIFPDRFYLEIQRHGIPAQDQVNAELVKMAADLRLPLVATNDAHYLEQHDHAHHDALLCIGTAHEPRHARPLPLRRRGLLRPLGRRDGRALPRPSLGASRTRSRSPSAATSRSRWARYHMPEFQVPAGTTREAVLERDAWLGLREPPRPRARRAAAREARRLRRAPRSHELSVIQSMGFAGYFLIVADFIALRAEARHPGRARARLLGGERRRVEPRHHRRRPDRVRHHLRALPEPRAHLDAGHRRRLLHARARRGDPLRRREVRPAGDDGRRVSQIVTFGTLQARAAIRDVGPRDGHAVRRRRPHREARARHARHHARRGARAVARSCARASSRTARSRS